MCSHPASHYVACLKVGPPAQAPLSPWTQHIQALDRIPHLNHRQRPSRPALLAHLSLRTLPTLAGRPRLPSSAPGDMRPNSRTHTTGVQRGITSMAVTVAMQRSQTRRLKLHLHLSPLILSLPSLHTSPQCPQFTLLRSHSFTSRNTDTLLLKPRPLLSPNFNQNRLLCPRKHDLQRRPPVPLLRQAHPLWRRSVTAWTHALRCC